MHPADRAYRSAHGARDPAVLEHGLAGRGSSAPRSVIAAAGCPATDSRLSRKLGTSAPGIG
jgi:hypothetical protein